MNFGLNQGFLPGILNGSATLIESIPSSSSIRVFFDPFWIPYCLFYSSLVVFHRDVISDRDVELFSFKSLRIPEKGVFYLLSLYASDE